MVSHTSEIHILHVDDEPDFAELAADMLEREDDRFAVETVTSPSKGLDRLSADDFDCIISDYDMPGQNGIEFLETVRDEHPDLPFILYTGKGSEEIAGDAISAGASDYLQKGRGTDQYELLANRIQNTVEQYRTSQRAAALDRVRSLASNINQALVRADSRSEGETTVCEIISESDPYLFAWIGEVDSETDRIEPRAWAGVEEGYLDDISVTADDTATGQGPGGTAVRERRIAVSQNIQEDPDFEQWREDALNRGYRAIAAVPLEYEGTLFGVLGVYAARPNAFDEDERELLVELGDDIAHAIHSFDVQEQLQTGRDRREALFENAPGPVIAAKIYEGGDEIRMTAVNEAFEDVFGYDTEAVVGKEPSQLIVPEKGMDRHEQFRNRAAAGETFVREVERVTADGPRTFLLHIIPYGIDESDADGLYAWLTDITGRRQRKHQLQLMEQLVEEMNDGAVIVQDGEIRYTNSRVSEVLGYSAEELVGVPVGEFVAPEYRDTVRQRYQGRIAGDDDTSSEMYEIEVVSSDGGRIPVELNSTRIEYEGEPATLSLVRDITERKAQERKREQIIDRVTDAIVDVDADWQFTLVNEQAEALYEMDEEDLLGRSFWDVFTEAEGTRFETEYRNVMETREPTSFTEYYSGFDGWFDIDVYPTDDGGVAFYFSEVTDRVERSRELERRSNRFQYVEEVADIGYWEIDAQSSEPHDVTLSDAVYHIHDLSPEEPFDLEKGLQFYHPEDRPTVEQAVEQAISDGGPYDYEVRLITASGEERWVHSVGEPVERDGEVVKVRGVFQDITDRKQKEEELARQNVRLDEFASFVSHDLQSPLRVAQGQLELAQEECDSPHLNDIGEAHERMETLIDDLLTLARTGNKVDEREVVDLGDTIDSCWGTVETGDMILVSETDQTIRADLSRLKQLLENLFRNAVEHGGDGVTVTVGDLEDRNGFYVADDGSGLPDDKRDEVFKAGYSTADEGTGLGLNIVQEIVRAHGWAIAVTDSEAGGTRFEITGIETTAE
jgi:PAS domain S-box-containing protein